MIKTVITIALTIGLAFSMNAQKLKSTDSYEMSTGFKETKKKYKANFYTKEIIFEDKGVVRIGDTLQLGETYSKLGGRYTSVYVGKITIGKAVLMGSQLPSLLAPTQISLNTYVVTKITVNRSMGKVGATFFLKDTEAKLMPYITAYSFSLDIGELINPNAPMNKEQAITKLKEAKELFELGVMTEADFNELRTELLPIITSKK